MQANESQPLPLLAAGCACIVALVLAYLWPALISAGEHVPSTYPDVFHFIWNGWYLQGWLSGEHGLYSTELIFYPFGARLELHTLAEGLYVPLLILLRSLSPVAVYVAAVLACFILNAIAALYLFFRLSRSAPLATLLALLFTFHPYFIAHLDAGHLNLLAFFPLLLVLGLILGDIRGGLRTTILGGPLVAYLAYVNLYYFYDALLLLAALIVAGVFCSELRWKRSEMIAVLVSGVLLALPRIIPTASLAFSKLYSTNHDPALNSLDLAHLFVPGRYQLLSRMPYVAGQTFALPFRTSAETAGYVSMLLLGLVLLFAVRLWGRSGMAAWLSALSLFFFVLSLGPAVTLWGAEISSNPVYLLVSNAPLFPSVPARFSVIAQMLLLCSLSAASTAVSAPRYRAALFLILVFSAFELWPRPVKLMPLPRSGAMEALRQSTVRVVHDMAGPVESRMFRQTQHGKALTEAFLARHPRAVVRVYRRDSFLRYLRGKPLSAGERPDNTKLGIGGVIVTVGDVAARARIEAIAGAVLLAADGQFAVYQLADSAGAASNP